MTLLTALGRVAAGLAAALACGAAVSGSFTGGLTRREKAAWSLASGLLVQAICLLTLFALGWTPRAPSLLLLEGVAAGAALVLRRRFPPGPAAVRIARGPRGLVLILSIVAGCAWLVFLVGAVADSMWATDFVAFWGYKGKIVFLSSGVPRRLFEDPALYFAHREYPLLVPLSLASLAGFAGEWNDQALALLYPVCALATLSALSGFLERRVSRLAGAVAATLSALCFFLYRPANAGTAEVPLALALVLACCAAGDALHEARTATLARLAVAALFCASLKQEGTLFVLLLAAALGWSLRAAPARSRRLAAAALVLPPLVHWAALYWLRGSQTRRDFDATLLDPGRWSDLPALFALVAGRLLGTEARANAVALLAVAAYFLATRRGSMDALLPVFVGQLLCYAIEPVFSVDPMFAIDSAFRRIVMSLFPAFTLVLCARAGPLDARREAPAGV